MMKTVPLEERKGCRQWGTEPLFLSVMGLLCSQLPKQLYEFPRMYKEGQGKVLVCLRKSGSLNMLLWRGVMKLLKVQTESCVPNFSCIHMFIDFIPKVQIYES